MSSSTTTSLSIQPWTRAEPESNALKDILNRIATERGHFRDLTESSLQEEIATEGALQSSESSEEADDDDDDDVQDEDEDQVKAKPTSREDLLKAKFDMLANIRAAEQEVLMSLDFVSLLLSKDLPKQASTTISPVLKESVPLGSLSTDLWQRMPVDQARQSQDLSLATSVRLQGLQQSANDLLSAANRLQANVKKETQYWGQVLSISEQGWNVSRMPGQLHKLGVRFGFGESAPQFSRRGLVALNSSSDGSVSLQSGVGKERQSLRVKLSKDGTCYSTSRLPPLPRGEEANLVTRIRHARDSLFDEELYHEMIREARTLGSLGVETTKDAIVLNTTEDMNTSISFELLDLNEDLDTPASPDNTSAQAVLLAARLLLLQAHRSRLKTRTEIPAPLSDTNKSNANPPLNILRPITAFFTHRTALAALSQYLTRTSQTLTSAKIPHTYHPATVTLPPSLKTPSPDLTAANLLTTLSQGWTSTATLALSSPSSADPEPVLTLEIHLSITSSPTKETSGTTPLISTFTLSPQPPQGRNDEKKKTYSTPTLPQLTETIDAHLASSLARALFLRLQRGRTEGDERDEKWNFSEREARVWGEEKGEGKRTRTRGVVVEFVGREGRLTVDSFGGVSDDAAGRRRMWTAGRDGVDGEEGQGKEEGEWKEGFWDVCGRIVGDVL